MASTTELPTRARGSANHFPQQQPFQPQSTTTTSNSAHQRPLRLLSMGKNFQTSQDFFHLADLRRWGGIRGLSTLVILEETMHRLQRTENLSSIPLPADYFDLICGTSTGGLIALLLGRLRLSVSEAITEYRTLSEQVFSVRKASGKDGTFKASNLERAIKEVITRKLGEGHAEDTMWQDGGCKTFVCAMPARHISKQPRLFRTWSADRNPGYNCRVWEAGRATSAAPTLFKRIKIGDHGMEEEFVDAGLGCNNPIQYLIEEAKREFGADRKVGCIVSIGTGKQHVIGFKAPGLLQRALPTDLIKVLVKMATDAEDEASRMKSRFQNCAGLYHRLNVERGLEDVSLEEWKELGKVKTHTVQYLKEDTVNKSIDTIITALVDRSTFDFRLGSLDGSIPDPGLIMSLTPLPTSTVPFERDRDFVGRTEIIHKLDETLEVHPRTAIYGLGGIGKSQIAIEYSYHVRDRVPEQWVFWVHSSHRDRFIHGYQEVAATLNIPGRDEPNADILLLVCNWLRKQQNGSWLLILDNVDDSAVLMKPTENSAHALLHYVPQVQHGKILVTSRDRTAAGDIVGHQDRYLIPVDCMNDHESIELVRSKLLQPLGFEDFQKLIEAMERIPLAITQACAYINQKQPLMSVSKYLSAFFQSQKNQRTLLEHNAADLRRDPNVPNAVITTWELSFLTIKEKYPSSSNLLSLMCLFDRQGIPDFLLMKDDDDLSFTNDISPLINFSMVKAEKGNTTFELHRLVQLATKTWLESQNQLQYWKDSTIRRISEKHPNGEFENWTVCNTLAPHVETILTYQPTKGEHELDQVEILGSSAWHLLRRGNLKLAEQRARTALSIRIRFKDSNHPPVHWIQSILALILKDTGQWKEAEELEVQVMETRERVLGQEHPDTLNSMSNLAVTIESQGRDGEAVTLMDQCVDVQKRVLGVNHPNTKDSFKCLESWKSAAVSVSFPGEDR